MAQPNHSEFDNQFQELLQRRREELRNDRDPTELTREIVAGYAKELIELDDQIDVLLADKAKIAGSIRIKRLREIQLIHEIRNVFTCKQEQLI